MRGWNFRLLAASVSSVALGIGLSAPAHAADPGISQTDSGLIAINLYEQDEGSPPQAFEASDSVTNPGGFAQAAAGITCATACSNPGAIGQSASGSQSALNTTLFGGSQAIRADADAIGATASAAGLIELAVGQYAQAPDAAGNLIQISGLLAIGVSAEAQASAGFAFGGATIGTGLWQAAAATGEDGSASNAIAVAAGGELGIAVDAHGEATGPGGGYANAGVLGVLQGAGAAAQAVAQFSNDGLIEIGALAAGTGDAAGAGQAFLTGFMQSAGAVLDVRTTATGTDGVTFTLAGSPTGSALASFVNNASVGIAATGAGAGGSAYGSANALGLFQMVGGTDAQAAIDNDGTFSMAALADADGGMSARASAIAVAFSQQVTALDQQTVQFLGAQPGVSLVSHVQTPAGSASASLTNAGMIALTATARAEASQAAPSSVLTNGWAAASASGLVQSAAGSLANATFDNQGSFAVVADALGDAISYGLGRAAASGILQVASAASTTNFAAVQAGRTQTFASSFVPAGEGVASFANSGNFDVIANAAGVGVTAASASALVNGIRQFAVGSLAVADITNSGELVMAAGAQASAEAFAYARARAIGIAQSASAAAQSGTRVYTPTDSGYAIVSDSAYYGVGTASALFANSGSITVAADADVVAGATAVVSAIASGITQSAVGANAVAELTNAGSISVVAEAAGAADFATVFAVAVNGFYQDIQALTGDGHAMLDNSGALNLIARAQASGDAAGAIAIGGGPIGGGGAIYQQVLALGGDASGELINSGEIIAGASALADGGQTAFASAVAGPGVNQILSGTAGAAIGAMVNSAAITLAANAAANAEGTATASAIAFNAFVQGAYVNGEDGGAASASMTNSGTLTVGVTADATAGGRANAVANGDFGLAQIALSLGDSARAGMLNSGSVDIAIAAHAAGSSANAQAAARSMVFQDAVMVGAGSAQGVIDNQGSIDVEVIASAEGEMLASAFAANSGMSQGVTAWEISTGVAVIDGASDVFTIQQPLGPASASLSNSGTLSFAARANSAASDGYAGASADNEGISQAARGTEAVADFANAGEVTLVAAASAQGLNAIANANVAGISQIASALHLASTMQFVSSMLEQIESGQAPKGPASVTLDNSGDLSIVASAAAAGQSALAGAYVTAIHQQAMGSQASATITNSGSIAIAALADAQGSAISEASARAAGIVQVASALATQNLVVIGSQGTQISELISPVGPVEAMLTNDGDISIVAIAQGASPATIYGFASASASGIVQSARGDGSAALLTNSGNITIAALADAIGGSASAYATAAGFAQLASSVEIDRSSFQALPTTGTVTIFSHQSAATYVPTGPASAQFENSGTFTVQALADAQGDDAAFAGVQIWGGTQDVNGISADVGFANSGDIALTAAAVAVADTIAAASAYNDGFVQMANATAIYQSVDIPLENGGRVDLDAQFPTGPATGSFVNDGSIEITSLARAETLGGRETGTTFAPGTVAFGTAYASGIGQYVWGTQASGLFENEGSIVIGADAEALGEDFASVRAYAQGVRQGVNTLGATVEHQYAPDGEYLGPLYNLYYGGPASATAINEGTLTVFANGHAVAAEGPAQVEVDARAFAIVASGTQASVTVDNAGTIEVSAIGDAAGTTGRVSAVAAGMTQTFSGGTFYNVDVANSGSIDILSYARAVQDNGATAIAAGIGLVERGSGTLDTNLLVDNQGTIEVDVMAIAQGGYFAGGTAYATGVSQRAGSLNADAMFDNSGTVDVAAGMSAIADADTGFAGATAFAHAYSAGATNLSALVTNSGTLRAVAAATAEGVAGWAWATAAGVAVAAIGGTTSAPALGTLNAAIDNSGSIFAVAAAQGIAGTDPRASTAEAVGILLAGGAVGGTVANSGLINVSASVETGDGSVTAGGIVVANNGQTSHGGDALITITNDGGVIIARESINGGDSWRRGTAIDLREAPNAALINLQGDGTIYGNIDINAGDMIVVSNGTTYFDGVINPECQTFSISAGDPSACNAGSLTIADGGNLILADSAFGGIDVMYDGPSAVFVDSFAVREGGTLTLQLRPDSTSDQEAGTYPTVVAETAELSGSLVAALSLDSPLLGDGIIWDNVIDAQTLTGTFETCAIAGTLGDSALVNFACAYDGQANVDLTLTRVAFDAVAGLRPNQARVGGGIETLYSAVGPAGLAGTPLGATIGELFGFNAADYGNALDQLSGAGYAGYLQSFATLGYRYNQLLARATDCEADPLARSPLACRAAPARLWGQIDYDSLSQDGDDALGAYDSDRWSFVVGGDVAISPTAVVGASLGKVSNDLRFDGSNARLKGDGWQTGLYASVEAGPFYAKAIGTYTRMDGDADRMVDFTPFGGTIAGSIEGDPDVRLWTLGLHGGYRIPLGAAAVITPFASFDLTRATLKGFAETGLDAANLGIASSDHDNRWLTGGVKWAGRIGGLLPEAMVGYRHRMGDGRATVGAGFLGFEEESAFEVISAAQKRGSLLAGLSLGGSLGEVAVRAGYTGAYNSDARQHGGFLKLTVPLGARATAAPTQPAAVGLPATVPAPATQSCADGSVILASDACPIMAPPPAVVTPERG